MLNKQTKLGGGARQEIMENLANPLVVKVELPRPGRKRRNWAKPELSPFSKALTFVVSTTEYYERKRGKSDGIQDLLFRLYKKYPVDMAYLISRLPNFGKA